MPGVPSLSSVPYPSEVNDQEWAILAPLLPPAKPGGRPRTVDLRVVRKGVFSVLRRGCQWRMLPRRYGPWSVHGLCRLSHLAHGRGVGTHAYPAA